jgi:hypothetical protein
VLSGHTGIAYLLRAWRRDTPMLALLIAAYLPDGIDAVFSLAGATRTCGLYSHSVPAALVLAAGTYAAMFAWLRRSWPAAAIALAVFLHIPADWVTGTKLMWPGGPVSSLVLYQRPYLDFALETTILLACWAMVRRDAGVPRLLRGWPLIALLIATQGAFDVTRFNLKPGEPTGCEVYGVTDR